VRPWPAGIVGQHDSAGAHPAREQPYRVDGRPRHAAVQHEINLRRIYRQCMRCIGCTHLDEVGQARLYKVLAHILSALRHHLHGDKSSTAIGAKSRQPDRDDAEGGAEIDDGARLQRACRQVAEGSLTRVDHGRPFEPKSRVLCHRRHGMVAQDGRQVAQPMRTGRDGLPPAFAMKAAEHGSGPLVLEHAKWIGLSAGCHRDQSRTWPSRQ
jgi:hypothetical protein